MSGRELASHLRAKDPNRPILFMSGYDDLSGTEDPFADEMVVRKPFKLVELAAAVDHVLDRNGTKSPAQVPAAS
jgi:DNA-binding response OmpR family regulator